MSYPSHWWQEKARVWHEMTMLREDWMEIVGDPDDATVPYRQWLTSKPYSYQTLINSTTSPQVIAGSIRDFLREKAH
jgi:hypothetical protein